MNPGRSYTVKFCRVNIDVDPVYIVYPGFVDEYLLYSHVCLPGSCKVHQGPDLSHGHQRKWFLPGPSFHELKSHEKFVYINRCQCSKSHPPFIFTETWKLSWYQLCHYLWHWRLSHWIWWPPRLPMMTKLAWTQLSVFSGCSDEKLWCFLCRASDNQLPWHILWLAALQVKTSFVKYTIISCASDNPLICI